MTTATTTTPTTPPDPATLTHGELVDIWRDLSQDAQIILSETPSRVEHYTVAFDALVTRGLISDGDMWAPNTPLGLAVLRAVFGEDRY